MFNSDKLIVDPSLDMFKSSKVVRIPIQNNASLTVKCPPPYMDFFVVAITLEYNYSDKKAHVNS